MTTIEEANRYVCQKLGMIPKETENFGKSTIDELEELMILKGESPIEILPNGEVRAKWEIPDFTTPSGRIDLLERMMKRKDWPKFSEDMACAVRSRKTGKRIYYISTLYLISTNPDGSNDKLARKVEQWFKEREGK